MGVGGKERRKGREGVKRKSPKAFISSRVSLFFHLSTSSVAMSQLFDIFPEETVLRFGEPVVRRPSPHLTLRSPPPPQPPPQINKTDLQIQLWKQAPTQSQPGFTTSGSRQPGSHVIEKQRQQVSSSPGVYSTPYSPLPILPSPADERAKEAFPLLYMKPPNSPRGR